MVNALKMAKLTLGSRICSKHFLDFDHFPTAKKKLLKRNAIPSQHIPVTLITERKKNAKQRDERRYRAAKRYTNKVELWNTYLKGGEKVAASIGTAQITNDSMEIEPLDFVETEIEQYDESDTNEFVDAASVHIDDYHHNNKSISISTQTDEVLINKFMDERTRKDFVLHLLDSDKNLNSFCGIATHQQLNGLVECVQILRKTIKKKLLLCLLSIAL